MIMNFGPGIEGGDILARPKQSGLGWHWGTALSDGRVAHTMPDIGKHVSSIEDFSAGLPVQVIRPQRTWLENLQIEQNALVDLGAPYTLASANCEHDMTRVHFGVSNSPSVRKVVIGLVFGAVVVAAFASDN